MFLDGSQPGQGSSCCWRKSLHTCGGLELSLTPALSTGSSREALPLGLSLAGTAQIGRQGRISSLEGLSSLGTSGQGRGARSWRGFTAMWLLGTEVSAGEMLGLDDLGGFSNPDDSMDL